MAQATLSKTPTIPYNEPTSYNNLNGETVTLMVYDSREYTYDQAAVARKRTMSGGANWNDAEERLVHDAAKSGRVTYVCFNHDTSRFEIVEKIAATFRGAHLLRAVPQGVAMADGGYSGIRVDNMQCED